MAKATPTVYYATGRRKTSAARVFLKTGTGKIVINGKALKEYTTSETGRMILLSPFATTETSDKFDVNVTVVGGGPSSQIGAVRHGISRALASVDENKHRPSLKKAGMLTRDARMVERKKYGRHKARKRPQFSKR